jgi:hypothetical protein
MIKEMEIPGTGYKIKMDLSAIITNEIIHDKGPHLKTELKDIVIKDLKLIKITSIFLVGLALHVTYQSGLTDLC